MEYCKDCENDMLMHGTAIHGDNGHVRREDFYKENKMQNEGQPIEQALEEIKNKVYEFIPEGTPFREGDFFIASLCILEHYGLLPQPPEGE